jgi:hypothetical protein
MTGVMPGSHDRAAGVLASRFRRRRQLRRLLDHLVLRIFLGRVFLVPVLVLLEVLVVLALLTVLVGVLEVLAAILEFLLSFVLGILDFLPVFFVFFVEILYVLAVLLPDVLGLLAVLFFFLAVLEVLVILAFLLGRRLLEYSGILLEFLRGLGGRLLPQGLLTLVEAGGEPNGIAFR